MGRHSSVLALSLLSTFINIYACASLDWSAPAVLNSTASIDGVNDGDTSPQIASDGAGNIVAVWTSTYNLNATAGTDPDVFVSRSADYGQTWTAVTLLNTDGTSDSSYDGDPWIATDSAGHWVCTWSFVRDNKQDIAVSRSSDNGQTWTAPEILNSDAATVTATDAYPVVETDGGGNWVCTWYRAVTNGGDDSYYSYSTDNGVTWSALAALNSDSQTEFGNDQIASLAADGSGNWVAVWQSNTPLGLDDDGDYDIHVARSSNDGVSWTNVAAANNDSADVIADDIRPTIATDGAGNWVMVWMSTSDLAGNAAGQYDIHAAHSTNDGATWTDPVAVNSNHAADTGQDFFPIVKTDGAGTWLCVWQVSGVNGSDNDIYYAESTDNGATWSTLAAANSNAASDSADDTVPRITQDGSGGWLAVWASGTNLGGTIGADDDIFFSRSSAPTGGTLTLTAPNGGEKWKIGKKKKITWTSTGAVGATVKLELLRNGNFVQNIKGSTKNDGKQKWKLPNTLTPGKGYKVQITDKSDATITDASDGSFRVKAAK